MMELGFFLPHVPKDILEMMAIKADSGGFDFMCCDDHLMSPFAPMKSDFDGCYEAWTTMAYLAGKTQNIKLSHMVLVPSFRGPAVLANMAATLDILYGGRLILSVGAGWFQREFEAYDIPWEQHSGRIQREREAIQIIRSLWAEERVSFKGEYYRLKEALLQLKPLQKPAPPIWVGGDSRPSMELAAELGDGWLMHGHAPEEVDRMVSKITPMLADKAKDFALGTAHFISIGPSREEAYQKMRRIIPPETWNDFMQAPIQKEIKNRISGSSRQCLSQLKQYAEAGLSHLILVFLDPGDVDIFVKEVLPDFRQGK